MTKADYKILLVEDEDHMIATIETVLGDQYSLTVAKTVQEARQLIGRERPALVLLDLGLPDEPGEALLREIREEDKELDVIVVTASRDVSAAVEAMKLNARDYITKPFEKEDLLLCIMQVYEHWKLKEEADRLRLELYSPYHFGKIVAKSPEMLKELEIARKMSSSDATVLITGESGTGKELVARAIHSDGTRSHGPFVAVNCVQFSGTLLESELFGHEKGAFTGAIAAHKGRFELADGGTLFLDEVGSTSPEMQAKILRVVESKQFERVGGTKTLSVDIRLIAATNADLEKAMREGRFREDLYYRLNVVHIEVPALRARKRDIKPLAAHFLAKYVAKTGHAMQGITPETMDVLMAYDWRGNVRELENMIQMAVALEEGDWLTTRYFPAHVMASAARQRMHLPVPTNLLEAFTAECERWYLKEQLRVHGGNHRKTARTLGIHRNTLENKIQKYGIGK